MAEPVAAEGCRLAKAGRDGQGPKKETEEVEAENAKDGVSLDELFKMKPEIFHAAPG